MTRADAEGKMFEHANSHNMQTPLLFDWTRKGLGYAWLTRSRMKYDVIWVDGAVEVI